MELQKNLPMIISRNKPYHIIKKSLEGEGRIFIIGCGLCATQCQSGGEEQVSQMKGCLANDGKVITGTLMIEAVCHVLNTKKELSKRREEVRETDGILVMSCGAGVQSVRINAPDKNVHPANDTLFLGNIYRIGQFHEHCSLCGECLLDKTGGICPLTRCSKGILNGPCGGMDKGRCEMNKERDCAWVLIYDQLEKEGRLDKIKAIFEPKNFNVTTRPASFVVEKEKII